MAQYLIELDDVTKRFIDECLAIKQDMDLASKKANTILTEAARSTVDNLWQKTMDAEQMGAKLSGTEEILAKYLQEQELKHSQELDSLKGDIERLEHRGLSELIAEDIKKGVKALGTACTTVKDVTVKGFKKIGELAKEGFSFMKEKTMSFLGKAKDGIKEAGSTVKEKFEDVAEAIYTKTEACKEGIKATAHEVGQKVTEARVNVNELVKKPLQKIVDKLDEKKKNLESKLDEKIKEEMDKDEKADME